MKRLLSGIIASVMIVSCTDVTSFESELEELSQKIAAIENECQTMNRDLAALTGIVKALQEQDAVTSVNPITLPDGTVEGYIFVFRESGVVTVYNGIRGKDGTDAAAPVVSVRRDADGKYYWVSDGEWVLDEAGSKVEVIHDCAVPKLKIEDDKWYVSYDEGLTWQYLGDNKEEVSGYVFKDVDLDDPANVKLILSDGSIISLPRDIPATVSLVCSSSSKAVPGAVLEFEYTVSGTDLVRVVVDDSDIEGSSLSRTDAFSGTVSLKLRQDVAVTRQRAFIIFNIDGETDDWWMVSFDGSGNVVTSDIR